MMSPFHVSDCSVDTSVLPAVAEDFDPLEIAQLTSSLKQMVEKAEKLRREEHRASMVTFRRNKKERQKLVQVELLQLESNAKLFLERVRAEAARSTPVGEVGATPHKALRLRSLVAEREMLWTQNFALRKEIERYENLEEVIRETNGAEERPSLSSEECSGWRVHFDQNEPSFHFHPFTRYEYEVGMQRFDEDLERSTPLLSMAANFFGWTIQWTPLMTSHVDNKSIVARVRHTKRINCPLDAFLQVSYRRDKDYSPTIVMPMGWSIHHRHRVSTQLLQEFSQDVFVFVHSIPGPKKHMRYLYLVRREQWQLPDGRRKMVLSMAISDTDANRRTRNAEGFQGDVEWITEGGARVSFTEVDERSIDLVCDRWAACADKMHANNLMLQWAQIANAWEQIVSPVTMLL